MKTISSSEEISHIFKHGRKVGTAHVTLIVMMKDGQHDRDGRVAFIAGKKLGGAVWRNRCKRRMRELCRELGGPFPGYDILFIAKRTTDSAEFKIMADQLGKKLSLQGVKP